MDDLFLRSPPESCVEMKMTVVQFRTLFAGEKSLHSDWIFLGVMHGKSRIGIVVEWLPKMNLQDLSLNQQMKCALSVMS